MSIICVHFYKNKIDTRDIIEDYFFITELKYEFIFFLFGFGLKCRVDEIL